jgi:hypothetical protein
MKRLAFLSAALCACAGLLPASGHAASADRQILRDVARQICNAELSRPPVAGASLLDRRQMRTRDGGFARMVAWEMNDGRRLEVTRVRTERVNSDLIDIYADHAGEKPLIRAEVQPNCRVEGGREIAWSRVDGKQVPVEIVLLNSSLEPTGKTEGLNPPVPPGQYRECRRIGILDNGVNYTNPKIATHLARDREGALVGYDFWDNDSRPFDFGVPPQRRNPQLSLFRPNRHGSLVASVLIANAPASSCIVPVRYAPFSQGDEVADAVAFFRKAGVRIVSLQSARPNPWPAFERAIRQNPDILFVVAAGNEGQDLTRQPLYPTSYRLPNVLVVGAADSSGKMWERSNIGRGIVDIAVNAVDTPAMRFDGSMANLSGTSFAAPKAAGFAATLLGGRDITGAQLKNEMVALARKSGAEDKGIPIIPNGIVGR